VRFSNNGVLANAEAAADFGGRMTLSPKRPEPSDGLVVPVEICVCVVHGSFLWWKVVRKSPYQVVPLSTCTTWMPCSFKRPIRAATACFQPRNIGAEVWPRRDHRAASGAA
jgi:hypothetical protein